MHIYSRFVNSRLENVQAMAFLNLDRKTFKHFYCGGLYLGC